MNTPQTLSDQRDPALAYETILGHGQKTQNGPISLFIDPPAMRQRVAALLLRRSARRCSQGAASRQAVRIPADACAEHAAVSCVRV